VREERERVMYNREMKGASLIVIPRNNHNNNNKNNNNKNKNKNKKDDDINNNNWKKITRVSRINTI